MELTFATLDLEVTANSSLKLDVQFGADARLVRQRLFELAAAENLAVLAEIPTLHFTSEPRGQFSVSVGTAGHIKFTSAADPTRRGSTPRTLELHSVTAIQIVAIGSIG